MEFNLLGCLLPLLLILPINGTNLAGNDTIPVTRQSKANKRIVRLYSGTRPKPIVCAGEGFQADPTDCTIFHRCMKNGNGRYVTFKFQCGPGTIYDPESEICNFPEKTKRSNCVGNAPIQVPNIDLTLENIFDNDISREVPLPISTRDPFSTQKPTTSSQSSLRTNQRTDASPITSKHFWATSQRYTDPTSASSHRASSSKWQDTRTTKTQPTKRQVHESFVNSITPSWMSSPTTRTTAPRLINRHTTSRTDDICTSEGLIGDSENCRKFYRCIDNQRGGFIKYEFMCTEPTIWDDDNLVCNHAWAVKRRRCGRGNIIDDNEVSNSNIQKNVSPTKDISPHSTQAQLQINYGSKVTQTQTQISNGSALQNQTQINYESASSNGSINKLDILQNQTQTAHGSAISQTQTQINYGDKAAQTQLQIDHSEGSSQSQSQISESTSTARTTQHHQSQSNPNSNNKCTKNGFIGDSHDCKKFYRCVDNGRGGFTRYEFSCGEGTVWDPKLEACNHAWAVKECSTNGKEPSELSTQSSTTIKTTQSFMNPTTVSSTSVATSKTTTQNYYSSTEEDIDEDNDIPYGNPPASSPTTKPPQQVSSTTKGPQISSDNDCKSSGFMGDNADCKKFYRCVDNGNGGYTRYEFSCGEGTVWDQKIEACNHDWAVENCGGYSSSTTTTTTRKTSSTPPETEDNDTGYWPQQNEPSSSSTSTTTIASSTVISQTTQLSSESNIGNDCTSSGFMGDNNDCKKFYRCVENGNGGYTRHEFSCGEGTVWDPKIQACNHAWAVEKCGGNSVEDINKVETTTRKEVQSTIAPSSPINAQESDEDNDVGYGQQNNGHQTTLAPHQSTTNPTSNQDNNSDCKSSGFMGDQNDCKKFYRCVDNGDGTFTRYEFSCGEGTVWDSKVEACNHEWAVEKCGGVSSQSPSVPNQSNSNEQNNAGGYPVQSDEYQTQSTSSTNSPSTSTTAMVESSTDNNCKTSGFMGDSKNCKRFYRCVDDGQGGFIKYEFSCGEGTVWDQSTEACNHDWAVKGQCSQSGETDLSNSQSTTQASYIKPEVESNGQGSVQTSTQKTTTTRPSTKPSENYCTQEGFYGDEHNCKNFYRCVDNGQGGFTKYEFTCGEGTVWNQEIQACDHEFSDNKCNGQILESPSTKPSNENDEIPESTTQKSSSTASSQNVSPSQKPQSSNDKCESEGFYGDSTNCKKFYRCVDDGQGGLAKYDFTCGDGTVWDQEILACNHETDDKKCTGHTESSSTTMSTSGSESSTGSEEQHTTRQPGVSNSPSSNDQCEMEGFFANSNDCKKFYRCVSNEKGSFTKYEFSCGEGTVWVQEIQACDYDNDISSCSNNNNSSTGPHTTQTQQSSTIASTSNNQYTTQSPNKNDDEYPGSSSISETEDCKSEGFFANKNDCTRFYRCVDNGEGGYTKYDFTCGEGTAWDSNIQTCNHKSDVESCQNTNEQGTETIPNDEESSQTSENSDTSTTKGSTSTESSKPSTDECKQEGYFGNTKNCKMFYRCVDDGKGSYTKYDFNCGEGTIWDQDLTTCNHPQDVVNPSCTTDGSSQSSSDGSSTTEGSGTTSSSSSQNSQTTTESSNQGSSNCSEESSSKKPTNQKVTCEKAGFYPDPDDCKKFYRCVDWDGNGERFSVYHFECGEGTIWDPQLDTCNHEESVYPPRDCSGAQSQNENTTKENTTTEKSTTSQDGSTTESTTTESSTDESTTQQSSSEQTTQQSSTTEKTTTTQQTSSEQTTQQSTTEKTTTQQTTSSEKTTQQSTTEQTTTESTTQEQTTQESSTSQQTTQQSTTSEQTTTSEKTTTEQTTTQQSTTSEQTTTQQSTTSEQTTTQQSTTSEQTTTQQSTTSEQTTQQSSSSEQTTQQSSSTDETTTESTTTEQTTTTTEQSNEQTTSESSTGQQATTTESSTTTTESSDSSTTEGDQSTTSSSSEKECPETEDDQYLFVCPTSFKRHPKYCNMFYQCTEDDDSHEVKIATFKCPNNTIYDESKTQCVEEEKADKKCNGEIARKYRVKRGDATFKEPIEASRNTHTCKAVGYYPFEANNECSGGFLKCQKTKSGKLRGYVHRCPEGYTFWTISKRCEKSVVMKSCRQSANVWKDRWEIPIERNNVSQW